MIFSRTICCARTGLQICCSNDSRHGWTLLRQLKHSRRQATVDCRRLVDADAARAVQSPDQLKKLVASAPQYSLLRCSHAHAGCLTEFYSNKEHWRGISCNKRPKEWCGGGGGGGTEQERPKDRSGADGIETHHLPPQDYFEMPAHSTTCASPLC